METYFMLHRLALLIFVFFISAAEADEGYYKVIDMPSYERIAFQKGEKVEYTIRYGMVHAGNAFFEVGDTTVDIGGRPHYYVKAEGKSNRVFDIAFKVRDYHFSYIDKETLLPTIYQRDTRQGSYDTAETIYFDRSNNQVRTGDGRVDVPPDIHDLLSAFYFARGVDFSKFPKNTKVDVQTFFAGDLFPVGAVVIGEEEISTSYGTFKCLVIEPILIPGRVFKDQRDMRLYVTRDKNQIPVRIETEVYVGRIRADLIDTSNLKYPLESRVN